MDCLSSLSARVPMTESRADLDRKGSPQVEWTRIILSQLACACFC